MQLTKVREGREKALGKFSSRPTVYYHVFCVAYMYYFASRRESYYCIMSVLERLVCRNLFGECYNFLSLSTSTSFCILKRQRLDQVIILQPLRTSVCGTCVKKKRRVKLLVSTTVVSSSDAHPRLRQKLFAVLSCI